MRRSLSFIGSIFTLTEQKDPNLSFYILSALHLESSLFADEVAKKLDERLLPRYPRWRSAISEGDAWVDLGSFVKAADHVKDVFDAASPEEFVAGLMHEKLPLTAPPWRFYLLHLHGTTCLVAQVHHAIGDGISLVETLCEICDVPLVLPHPRESSVGWLRFLYLCLVAFFHSSIVPLIWSYKDTGTCVSGYSSSPIISVAVGSIDLKSFKRDNFTINDVVTSAVCGALRRFLIWKNDSSLTDPSFRFSTFIAVNMRGKLSFPIGMGNKISYAIIPLPLNFSDPVVRLSKIHETLNELKHSPEVSLNYYILCFLFRLVGFSYVYQKANELYQRSSLVMTNVPGPTGPISFCGRRVKECYFSLAPQKNGFLVSILSYCDKIYISVSADASIVGKDGAKKLLEFIKDE
jgi:diacylglycerol O-acyltransferase